MELSNDRGVAFGQILQHSLDLIIVVDPLHIPVRVRLCLVDRLLMSRDVSEFLRQASLSYLSDDDPSRNHRQVGGQ